MPRYFIHISSLPDLWGTENTGMIEAIWHEVCAKQFHPGEILIIKDGTPEERPFPVRRF